MTSTRRAFLAVALSGAASRAVAQTSEEAVLLDLPPKSSLWGAAMFFADDLVQVSMASAKNERAVTGRFQGKRLAEVVWRNTTSQSERVVVRARVAAAHRELSARGVRYVAGESIFAGFGHRPLPSDPRDREGAYPYQAVFVGFIVFGYN